MTPHDVENPRRAAQALAEAALLIEQCGGGAALVRDVERFAAQVALTPVWERVDTRHYRTVIDGQRTDLRKRDDGQWTLEADWLDGGGIRWFRTRVEAQGWVKRQVGAA